MKDKSFFKRIFIMLIAMEFVLLVGVLTVQGYVVSKSSMDEMSKSSEDKLGVIRGYTEVALKDIEKTTLYIALDENISVLDNMRGRELSDTDTVLELYKLVDFLKLQKSVDNRIDSIYIYHDELGLTVTSDGDICRNGKPADTEWKSFYDKESGFFWTGRRVLKKGMENYDVITLVYPFKNINSSTNYAVVANVSLNALSNVILSEYNAENSSVCIIDTNGQTIAGTLDERYDADIAAEISDGESIVKDSVLYTCEVAENNGWKYVNAMPVRFPDNQSRSIIAGILAAGCCMLIVGVLISYFISKRIARPIEQLMRKLNVRKQGDEFEIINEAFEAKKGKIYERTFRRNGRKRGISQKMPYRRYI